MPDEVQSRAAVRAQGEKAYRAGMAEDACPYVEGTSAYMEWMRGYKDALYCVPKSFTALVA